MRLRGSGKGVDFQNGDRDSVRGVDSVLVDIYFSVLSEFHGGEYWICIYILDWIGDCQCVIGMWKCFLVICF